MAVAGGFAPRIPQDIYVKKKPVRDADHGGQMLVDPNAPFFRPLWVRVLCVASPLAWAAVELSMGSPFWAILFGAAGLYLGFQLFIRRQDD